MYFVDTTYNCLDLFFEGLFTVGVTLFVLLEVVSNSFLMENLKDGQTENHFSQTESEEWKESR